MERVPAPMCLSCGTSLERIAPESLTRNLFGFVHGDISRHSNLGPQDRVADHDTYFELKPRNR